MILYARKFELGCPLKIHLGTIFTSKYFLLPINTILVCFLVYFKTRQFIIVIFSFIVALNDFSDPSMIFYVLFTLIPVIFLFISSKYSIFFKYNKYLLHHSYFNVLEPHTKKSKSEVFF